MKRPNIVLICADDIGFNEIGVYQSTGMPDRDVYAGQRVLTPHIDSLASQGVVFSRYYATSSICSPSRYSILTGRLASRSPSILEACPPPGQATIGWNTRVDRGETNLAKVLKSLGYATGFVGKWHTGEPRVDVSTIRDIDDPRDPTFATTVRQAYETRVSYLREGFGFDFVDRVYFGNREGFPGPLRVHNLEWLSEGADQFIQSHHDQPFFLYLALSTPHGDHFTSFLQDDPLRTPAGLLDELPRTLMPPRREISARLQAAGVSASTAMSTWQDDCVGAVLARLDQFGLTEKTVVIFTCDHLARGKYMCYEGCRVPFLVRWPAGIAAGRRVEALCANVDLAASLAELAGGRLPDDYLTDGRSFAPLLLDATRPAAWRDHLLLECSNIRGIVTDRWKYIASRAPANVLEAIEADQREACATGRKRWVAWDGNRNPHPQYVTEGVRYFDAGTFPHYFDPDQLYDLASDVFEQHNVIADPSNAAVLNRMRALLKQELGKLPHSFGEFAPPR
jgi:arylsulfatase A-like enzyme